MKLLICTQKVDVNDDILGFFHDWIVEFAKNCEQVTVICLYKGDYELPANVKVISLGKESNEKWKQSKLFYIPRFYKTICNERRNYSHVFVHMNPEYVVLGGLLWRFWKKRISLWFTHKNVNFILKIAEKLTNIVFTASKESFRLKSKKVEVVGHGIDVSKFTLKDDYSIDRIIKIISVGRISPIKDYETLISAVEIIKEKGIDIQVSIVGDAPVQTHERYLAKLNNIVAEKKLDNEIKFLGAVPYKEINQYLAKAHLFVHTSQTGSLDKAMLEAAASGLIVLSCNDASKDFFNSMEKLLFFKSGDYNELARKIIKISNLEQDKRNKIISKLTETVKQKHSLDLLINNIFKLFKSGS